MQIYEPAEDSYLLEKSLHMANGKVLDMGTGSGYLANSVIHNPDVIKVFASDINPASKKKLGKNITFFESNLFSNIPPSKFDTIIFNPPYLPNDEGISDPALYGGKQGWETIEKFLANANNYLAKTGIILLLFSSHTNKNMVDTIIAENLLEKLELEKKRLPLFETLYVYKISKSEALKSLENIGVSHLTLFAKGNRGLVYLGILNKRRIAVKTKNKNSATVNSINNEAHYLKLLNDHGIGPNLLHSFNQTIVMEFINGTSIDEYKAPKEQLRNILLEILLQCRTLDKLNISKEEMMRPHKHVIIRNKKPVMIDFDRCRKRQHPQNVTQFCQYLSKNIRMQNLTLALKKYKKSNSDAEYKNIESIVKNGTFIQ